MHQRVNIIETDQFNARLFQLNHVSLSFFRSLFFVFGFCMWCCEVEFSRVNSKKRRTKSFFSNPTSISNIHVRTVNCALHTDIFNDFVPRWISEGSTQFEARIVIHSSSSNYYKTNKNLFSNVEMSWPFSFRINNLSTNLETLSVKITWIYWLIKSADIYEKMR